LRRPGKEPRARHALAFAVVAVAACSGPKPPVAVAGPEQIVTVGQLVQLDGSGSHDPSGKPITFEWTFVQLPSDSHATLNAFAADGSTAVNPSFPADVGGDYVNTWSSR